VTLAAGIDVGNSTTEVVLGRLTGDRIEVVAAGRAPTRRAKGSPESLDGAAALVRRLQRQHGVEIDVAAAAPLRPVETGTASVPEDTPRTGRLWVAGVGAGTAGGDGLGTGRPHLLGSASTGTDAVVALVPAGMGYRSAVDLLLPLVASGRLTAVVLADDEAVLVANRLPVRMPVVDEVDVGAAMRADRLAVECSWVGRPLRALPDPLRLAELLALADDELADAAALAPLLLDATNAVVALGGRPDQVSGTGAGWLDLAGTGRVRYTGGHDLLRAGPVGLARAYALPPDLVAHDVDDLWSVDLAAVARDVAARRGGASTRPVTLAALRASAPYADPSAALAERLGVAVLAVTSEAAAARCGALSTPGATGDTVVVDLGGGTIDAVSAAGAVVAAGGGELLTVSVAALTGCTAAAAEHVKRGPAHRVEAPQVLLAEDGTRRFLDQPAARDVVGALVVRGPAGLLAFHRSLAPGEWRALRLRLKVALIGANVARALRTLDVEPRSVVVVGGPAGDDEVLAAVTGALPAGTAVGRGNVSGTLGHRYAVAYGLLEQVLRSSTPPPKSIMQ
jgi:Diol dehydratase reactivase ATPase-like domain/DD-reactivating factor swiveling domain